METNTSTSANTDHNDNSVEDTTLPLASEPSNSTANLLSFPSASRTRTSSPPVETQPPREQSKTRLYVGNLHPTVDEYTLLQVFTKYGKIAKLDFLFHKSGPAKGKPRGYAFIEYSDKEDALKALVNAHDKLLRGRKIVVTYANHAPNFDAGPSGSRPFHRRTEVDRPTTLSLLKSNNRLTKTEDKIAALEAKLRQLEKPVSTPSSLLPHPSLPSKPSASTLSASDNPKLASTSTSMTTQEKKYHTSRNRPSGSGNNKPSVFPRKGNTLGPGKKPTLEELIKMNKSSGSSGSRSKR